MARPSGIAVRTCTIGVGFGQESAADLGATITVKSSEPELVWAATGSPGVSDPVTITIEPGAEASFDLIPTDLTGWLKNGAPVDVSDGRQSHYYTITVQWTKPDSFGRPKPVGPAMVYNRVVVPSGSTPLDLDTVVQWTGATGQTISLPAELTTAVTDAQSYAEQAASSAQSAHDLSQIDTSDGVVTALVADGGSATTAQLKTAVADYISDPNPDPTTNPVPAALNAAIGVIAPPRSSQHVYLGDYLTGGVSDTTAFLNAITAAAGKTLHLGGRTLSLEDVIEISSNSVSIDARGATIDLTDDGTATGRIIRVSSVEDFTWLGGKITQTAAARTGVYGLLTLDQVSNALIDSPTIDGGSSVGIFASGGSGLIMRTPVVRNTKADGIQVSRGIYDVAIISPIIDSSGDDGIGVVSVTAEPSDPSTTYPQIKRVTITDPIITNISTAGGSVSFVGCADATLRGGTVDTAHDAGVKITNDATAGASQAASNVNVIGTLARNAPFGFSVGVAENCTLTGVQGVGNTDSGLSIVGSTNLLVNGGRFNGNAGFGIYEASGTGNNIIGADLRGNTAGASQVSSAVLTSCITA